MKYTSLVAACVMLAVSMVSCPSQLGEIDLRTQIEDAVKIATANVLDLVLESDGNGFVTPTGTLTAKENIPLDISAAAFATHTFFRWAQTGGTGVVVIADPALANTTMTLSGGSATVRAEFNIKPKVLYATPIGKDIPKNSRVTVVFSKDVDPATIDATTIMVKEEGVGNPLAGQLRIIGNQVRFDPDTPFNAYKTYVISAVKSIQDTGGIGLLDDYTSAFKTNNLFDNEPPVNGVFIIDDGIVTHTNSSAIVLNNIFADDDSEIAAMYIYDESNGEPVSRVFSSSTGWTLSSGDGEKTIYMNFEDQIGNITPAPTSRTIILDTTPPTGTVTINSDASFAASVAVTLTLSAVDPVAGTKDGSGIVSGFSGEMLVSNDADFSTGAWEQYSASKAWNLAPSDGVKTVYVKFRDALGNETATAVTDTIYLDTTYPTGTLNDGVIVATNSASVTVSLSLSDGSGSGVDQVQLVSSGVLNGSDWSSSSGDLGVISSGGTSWTPAATSFTLILSAGEGSKTIQFRVKDVLGNEGTVAGSILYDTTLPSTGSFMINANDAQAGSPSVTLTSISCSDPVGGGVSSSITWMALSNVDDFASPDWIPYATSASWSLSAGDEVKTVYMRFKDAAGNISATSATDTITLNTIPPDGNFYINNNATYTTATAVTLNLLSSTATQMCFSNDGSSYSAFEAYPPTSKAWTLPTGDGTKTVYVKFKDAGGLVSAVVSDNIILDTTAPAGTITILGTGDGTNTYTKTLTGVALSVSAADAGSGLYQMRFNAGAGWLPWETYSTSRTGLTLSNPSGTTYTVQCQIRDKALLDSVTTSDTIVYDVVVPTISSFSLNGNAANTNSYYVTLNSTASDALSGIYQLSVSNTSGTTGFSAWETYAPARASWLVGTYTVDGTKNVWLKVRDKAGNESTVSTDSIVMDRTAPALTSVAINGGAATTPFMQTTVSITASDALSGLAQYQQYYNGVYGDWTTWNGSVTPVSTDWNLGATPGTHSVYVNVKDTAGNVSSWVSDSIVLEAPTPLYARKGYNTGSYTYVYGSTIEEAGNVLYYRIYSTTNPSANPNVDPGSVEESIYSVTSSSYPHVSTAEFSSQASTIAGELRYFFVRATNSTKTRFGPYSAVSVPGWTSNITVVYNSSDSTDTALAASIKTTLETSLSTSYPTSIYGTQPIWKVTLVPESLVSTTYVALVPLTPTNEQYWRYNIYGAPTIVTPATSVYANANKVRNIVGTTVAARGVVGIGYGGTRLLDYVNSYWTTWGLAGQQPTNLGYMNSAGFSDTTLNGYTWTISNTVWSSPLYSNSIPGGATPTHNALVQMSYQNTAGRYSIYRLNGAAITGGLLLEREYSNANYFTVALQGRFAHVGFTALPDRPYTGKVFLVNLIALMDNY